MATTVPPKSWIAVAPVAPSWPLPLSTTATATVPSVRGACWSAGRLRAGSAARRGAGEDQPDRRPGGDQEMLPGGRHQHLAGAQSVSVLGRATGRTERSRRRCTRSPVLSGCWCKSTRTVASSVPGRPASTSPTASRPPTEATSAITDLGTAAAPVDRRGRGRAGIAIDARRGLQPALMGQGARASEMVGRRLPTNRPRTSWVIGRCGVVCRGDVTPANEVDHLAARRLPVRRLAAPGENLVHLRRLKIGTRAVMRLGFVCAERAR